MRRFRFLVWLCGFLIAFAVCRADELATVTGLVTDPSGRGVPGVTISITNLNTNVSLKTVTNESGIYRVTSLQPGTYRIVLDKDGFKSIVNSGIALHVQDVASINYELEVGSVSETVTVAANRIVVNTTDASVGTVVDRQYVANMPLNGRSFQNLITLTPGVATVPAVANNPGQFVVNGQRSDANYFTVDGVSANAGVPPLGSVNAAGAGSAPITTSSGGFNSIVSVDALQEFRISTSSFAPEYGRTPGGQVSLISRSGTNDFHGDVFDYLRNTVLDANDWFLNAAGIPRGVVQQNDFGGVVGGPILKGKLFFFGSYEGLRLNSPSPVFEDVPTQSARDLAAAAMGNGVQGYMAQFLNAYPLPDGNPATPCTSADSCIAPLTASLPATSRLDATSVRLDYTLNTKLIFFGRYAHSPSRSVSSNVVTNNTFQDGSDVGSLGLTYAIDANKANDLRFGVTQATISRFAAPPGFAGDSSTIFPSGFAQPPAGFTQQNMLIQFGGFFGISDFVILGPSANNSQRQINLTDTFSLNVGSHALKFGADFRQLDPEIDQAAFNARERFTGKNSCPGGLPAYICGLARFTNIQHNAAKDLRVRNWSFFAQDTWKVSPRLTLTYGLRYEVNPALSSTNGKAPFSLNSSHFSPTDLTQVTLNPFGSAPYPTSWGNISPRVGAAYQLSKDRRWNRVLRAGFGVFYDTADNAFSLASNPFGAALPEANIQFPVATADASAITPPDFSLTPPFNATDIVAPNLKLPYVYQMNVAVQQQLGDEQSLTVGYVGAVGRRLVNSIALPNNLVNPAIFNLGLLVYGNYSTSDYSALQAQFQRQFSRGLGALVSYTWGHSIDTASNFNQLATVSIGNTGLPESVRRASSDFDVRQTVGLSLVYEIPTPFAKSWLARAVLGGWSVDPMLHYQTAVPVDVFATTNASVGSLSGLGQRPNLIPGVPVYLFGSACSAQNIATFGISGCPGGRVFNNAPVSDAAAAAAGCQSPANSAAAGAFCTPLQVGGNDVAGNVGRNAFRAFPLQGFDLSVNRDIHFSERYRLRFQADVFNVFNHPVFGSPDSVVTSGTFGIPVSMANTGLGSQSGVGGGFSPLYSIGGPRNIQLALKLFF